MWKIEPLGLRHLLSVLVAIVLTIDDEHTRTDGWFESQTRGACAHREVIMFEFCDYIHKQVICVATTHKASASFLAEISVRSPQKSFNFIILKKN